MEGEREREQTRRQRARYECGNHLGEQRRAKRRGGAERGNERAVESRCKVHRVEIANEQIKRWERSLQSNLVRGVGSDSFGPSGRTLEKERYRFMNAKLL